MKNLAQTLFILFIIAVIFAFVYNWTKKQLSTLAQRLIIVEREIEIALDNLQLTMVLRARLDRKVKLIFYALKMLCCLLLAGIWFFLTMSGAQAINAIFDTFNLVGLSYILISLIVFNKLTDTNVLISIIKKKIRMWVYRRAKFDPQRIVELQDVITAKRIEAFELRRQLDS